MKDHEVPLEGGNISQVVRAGDTVRRQTAPWSRAVHGLLQHLEAQGFDGAPRFLGIDEQGREILTYLPGDVGSYPLQPFMWSDASLIGAGALLRRLHDATVDYCPPDPGWQFAYPDPSRHEVICHNDVAPYNTVFVEEQPRAFIDFDTAGPGPRIWDVAYAAYAFVPLAGFAPLPDGTTIPYEPSVHATERRRRLRILCEAYGMDLPDEFIGTVVQRLRAMCAHLTERASAGDPAYVRLVDDGHFDHYRQEAAFVQRYGQEW